MDDDEQSNLVDQRADGVAYAVVGGCLPPNPLGYFQNGIFM